MAEKIISLGTIPTHSVNIIYRNQHAVPVFWRTGNTYHLAIGTSSNELTKILPENCSKTEGKFYYIIGLDAQEYTFTGVHFTWNENENHQCSDGVIKYLNGID